jgi:hypothetical protein
VKTAKSGGTKERVPGYGVPAFTLRSCIEILIKGSAPNGFKVARCQSEDVGEWSMPGHGRNS